MIISWDQWPMMNVSEVQNVSKGPETKGREIRIVERGILSKSSCSFKIYVLKAVNFPKPQCT
jgi:hypothetical protein